MVLLPLGIASLWPMLKGLVTRRSAVAPS
jgi:hypothetical protein